MRTRRRHRRPRRGRRVVHAYLAACAQVNLAFSSTREASGLGQRSLFISTFLGVGTDLSEVFLLLRYVLFETHGRRSGPRPLQPERGEGRIYRLPVDDVGVGVAFELQIGDYGVRFFSGEDRKAIPGIVVGGHGTVPPRVDERSLSVPHFEGTISGR